MESLGYEDIIYWTRNISEKESCSEEEVDFLMMLMKRNIKNLQSQVDTIEKYREGVVFKAKYLTDAVYSQWSSNDSLSAAHFVMFHRFGKDKQRKEDIANAKKEKEEEKNKEINNVCQMFESQNLQ